MAADDERYTRRATVSPGFTSADRNWKQNSTSVTTFWATDDVVVLPFTSSNLPAAKLPADICCVVTASSATLGEAEDRHTDDVALTAVYAPAL